LEPGAYLEYGAWDLELLSTMAMESANDLLLFVRFPVLRPLRSQNGDE
jgi:hypothetical protein